MDARVIRLRSTQIHSATSIKQGHHSGSLWSLWSVRLCSMQCFTRDSLINGIQCNLQSLCSWGNWGLGTHSRLHHESVSDSDLRPRSGFLDGASKKDSCFKPQIQRRTHVWVLYFILKWSAIFFSFFNASTACYRDIYHKKKASF